MRTLLVVLLGLAVVLPVSGQCWGQSSPGQFVPNRFVPNFQPAPILPALHPVRTAPTYTWVKHKNGEGECLYRDGVQVGWYDYQKQMYRPYDPALRTWGDWTMHLPVPAPLAILPLPNQVEQGNKEKLREEPIPNFGIDLDRLKQGDDPRYGIDGKPVNRREAVLSLEKTLPNDGALDRLTVFGPKEQRHQICKLIENDPRFKEFQGKLLIQDYPEDHWYVSSRRFRVKPGEVTIYYQKSDGTVLDRWEGNESPEKLLDRLRRRGKPVDKPLLPKILPSLVPLLGLSGLPWSIWVLGGIALLGFFWKRRGVARGATTH